MIAGYRRTDLTVSIATGIGTDGIYHQLVLTDVLAVGSTPVCCAQSTRYLLIANCVTVDGVERVGKILMPAAAIASCGIRTINTIALQRVGQIGLLLHTRSRRKRAGMIAKITHLVTLVLSKAYDMGRTRRSVLALGAKAAEALHPVALTAFIADAGFGVIDNSLIVLPAAASSG